VSKGLVFWGLMIVWAVFGVLRNRNADARFAMGGDILEFVLFFLLGWAIFGFVIQ
jgi:hypothetical protein